VTLRSFWNALLRRGRSAAGADEPRPPDEAAGAALDRARRAFADGQLAHADELAGAALRTLERALAPSDAVPFASERRAALESALLAVRGGAAARAGRMDDALALFERSRECAARSRSAAAIGAAALNLLDVGTRRGRRDAGDPLFEEAARAVRRGPHEDVLAKVVMERGVAAVTAGALEDAAALFDRAIALRPAWPAPWYQRGWTRFLRGDASGALEDYRECARRRTPFFTVQREIRCLEDVAAGTLPLGAYRSYCVVRDRIRAQPVATKEAADRMLERLPQFAPAHLLRAESLLALGEADAARAAAGDVMRSDPDADTAAAALLLLWNFARAKAEDDALREVEERLLEAYRDSPAAEIVRRMRGAERRDVLLRWTWALDGTLRLEEGLPMRPGGGSVGGG
jgi:tetratricopeptide (TPR) repeat protein